MQSEPTPPEPDVGLLARWTPGAGLSDDDAAAVEAERVAINLRRTELLTASLLVVQLIGTAIVTTLVVPTNEPQRVWRENTLALTWCSIAVNVVALLCARSPRLAARAAEWQGPLVVLWGALTSANIQRTRPAVDLFLAASFGIVLGYRHRLRTVVMTQLAAATIMFAGILWLQPDRAVARTELAVVLGVTVSVVLLGRANLVALVSEVTSRRVIERQRQQLEAQTKELAELNSSLERKVDEQVHEIVERSRDIDRLNSELREKVRDRSRELSALLARMAREHHYEPLAAGNVLSDRFEIESIVGQGGMGVVYAATDRVTRERVAIKVISAVSAHELDAMHRFLREAQASVRVSHSAIVSARHVDLSNGRLYLVFPFVDGETLDRALQRTAMPIARAARIAARVADALAAAHATGLVHRDIKPGNVMLTQAPEGVRVLDFGISKLHDAALEDPSETREGVILGTPTYMAPEQVSNSSAAGDRADVYSLGVVLYEMLCGRPPYTAENRRAVMLAHVVGEPPPLRSLAPRVPEPLAELVHRCLSKHPEGRPSAAELSEAIGALEPELAALGDLVGPSPDGRTRDADTIDEQPTEVVATRKNGGPTGTLPSDGR